MTTLAIHRVWGVYELVASAPYTIGEEVVAVPFALLSQRPGPIQRAWDAVEACRG